MPDRIADVAGHKLEVDFHIDPQVLAGNPRLHVGRLLTVDRVIGDVAEKRALGAAHAALAVDMESLAVAEVCRREQVRFLAVRVISDASTGSFRPRSTTWSGSGAGPAASAPSARRLLRRPSSIKDMWQLKEDALVASERLGQFLVGVIEQLG